MDFTTVIVFAVLVFAAIATVAFIRGGKAMSEDLSQPGGGAISLTEADYALGADQADSVADESEYGLQRGSRVSFTTDRGRTKRIARIVRILPLSGTAVVETDDDLPDIRTTRGLQELTLL